MASPSGDAAVSPAVSPAVAAQSRAWVRFLPARLRARVQGRDELQRVVGNTGWLVADRGVRLVVGMLTGAIVTRYLGPERFGVLNYAVALVGLLGFLTTLGVDQFVLRDLARTPGREAETLGTGFAIRLAGAALTIVVALVLAAALRPGDAVVQLLTLITALGAVFQSFEMLDAYFQSRIEARYTVYARGVAFVFGAALRVGLALAHAPLWAFAAAALAEIALAALALCAAYRAVGGRMAAWRASWPRARELLRQSWPLMLSGAAIGIYMRIDMLMVGALAGDAEVGIYSAAYRLSELWFFVPAAIVTSLAPGIAAAKLAGEERYYARLRKLFDLLALLAVAIAIPTTFLATPLLTALYGPAYAAAGPVLALHVWSALFVFLGMGQNCWTVNENLAYLELPRTVAGAIVNVALNVAWIPRYGAMGAAAATVVSYALSAVLLNAVHPATRPVLRLQLEAIFMRRARLWLP